MQSLQIATDNFVSVLSTPSSTNEEINTALQTCYTCLKDSDDEGSSFFLKKVIALCSLPDMEKASIAATICGYLVEKGFPSSDILEPYINFYEGLLDKSRSFYEIFFSQIRQLDEVDEEREEKTSQIFAALAGNRDVIAQDVYDAVVALGQFYFCGISLFSVNKENFSYAKNRLKDKVTFVGEYNQGCFWMNKLFSVLFDESIVVIDIDRKIGLKGKMSGVVDNYQLQYLLMSLPALNDGKMSISEDDLKVINGEGEQKSDRTIVGKWNMYNLELCEEPNWENVTNSKLNKFSNTWIWGEGTPSDISVHDGYRVILLGTPSYDRSASVQRTFVNLKASIEIEKELSVEEINNWLN